MVRNIFLDFRLPWGVHLIRFFKSSGPTDPKKQLIGYRILVLFLTYCAYTAYHLSRKPSSVVKNVLLNCTGDGGTRRMTFRGLNETDCTSFINELNTNDSNLAHTYLGLLDTSFLGAYALFMFFSGYVAERVDLRYFLFIGMTLSGFFTVMFGVGKYLEIHSLSYYLAMQFLAGSVQSSGWPGVVTVVAKWFGKGKKGLIFGIWNSHTSVGNILGGVLAGMYVDEDWAMSFIVPGLVIAATGLLVWFALPARPLDIGFNLDEIEPEVEHLHEVEEHVVVRVGEGPNAQMQEEKALHFWKAFFIPGVVEFSACLFFAKLVSYTFLYWLPAFIKKTGHNVDSDDSAYLATLFDVGGIVGAIVAGLASDRTSKPAIVCAVMSVSSIPSMMAYNSFSQGCPLDPTKPKDSCYVGNIGLLILNGILVNGPYSLITTAVSAELGTHRSIQGSSKALATVTAIIDGTGSIGAAVGPYVAGAMQGNDKNDVTNVFYMLMGAACVASLCLGRLTVKEIKDSCPSRSQNDA